MHFSTITTTLFSAALLAMSVSAHGIVSKIQGANGKNGVGFGVTDPNQNQFNQVSKFTQGDKSPCGSNNKGTPINVKAELDKATKAGLPSVAKDGSLSMTVFQVNGDGAGPYKMEVSADATGGKFVPMKVTTQVPGKNGRSNAANTPFPLVGKMPEGLKCTGPSGACLVRVSNLSPGSNLGFGGCMAVTQSSASKRSAPRRMTFSDAE